MSFYDDLPEVIEEQKLTQAINTNDYELLQSVDVEYISHDTEQELTLLFHADRRFRDWVWTNFAGIADVAYAYLTESDFMPDFKTTVEQRLTLLSDMIRHAPGHVSTLIDMASTR